MRPKNLEAKAMSEPCPLCGREKLKDRVRREPPMRESPDAYCLHPGHIYDREMPPCEAAGIARITKLEAVYAAARHLGFAVGHETVLVAGASALEDVRALQRALADVKKAAP